MSNIPRAIFIQTVLVSTLPCLTTCVSFCLQAKKFVGVQLHNRHNQPLSLGWSWYEPFFGFSTSTAVNYISMLDTIPYIHSTSGCVSHSLPQSLTMTSYKHQPNWRSKPGSPSLCNQLTWRSLIRHMNLQCGLERNQPLIPFCVFFSQPLEVLCHSVPQKSRNVFMFVNLVWMAQTKAYIILSFHFL